MLKFLSIENFALIEKAEIEFEAGLNLVTGETGSGKSILVGAVGLLGGGRAYQDTIRQGCPLARVEGLFELKEGHPADPLLKEAGIELDGRQLVIRREISATGANKIFLNGRLSTGSFLSRLGQLLIDIHGQHDQQQLLQSTRHLDYLDAFADNAEQRGETARLFRLWSRIKQELAAIEQGERERLQRLDTLRFQRDEIERLNLSLGLDQELDEERRLLSSAQSRFAAAGESFQILYENDGAVLERMGQVEGHLEELGQADPGLHPEVERFRELRFQLEETAFLLRDYRDGIEFDPRRQEKVEERLDEIQRICRKYGSDLEGVLNHLASLPKEIERLENTEARMESLAGQEREAVKAFRKSAQGLSDSRRRGAGELGQLLVSELDDLAMPEARMEVRIESQEEAAGEKGIDQVEFLISPNPGEDPRPLARIASGGELSRLILALKSILTLEDYPKTLVFDEVDAGIGGRTASKVGRRLATLAREHQVFCVTHSPQIACWARRHLRVGKQTHGSRTVVDLTHLTPEARRQELARMLAGDRVSGAALKNAEELLARAEKERSALEMAGRRPRSRPVKMP